MHENYSSNDNYKNWSVFYIFIYLAKGCLYPSVTLVIKTAIIFYTGFSTKMFTISTASFTNKTGEN